MLGAYYDIKLATNEDLSFYVVATQDDEDGTALDLSGYTGYMDILDSDDTKVLDCDSYITISGDDNNIITVNVTAAIITANLSVGTYSYDLLVSDGSETSRICYGYITVSEGYTVI